MFKEHICVVGLGYVGFPLIHKFAEAGFRHVTGVDVNEERLSSIVAGEDHTDMVPLAVRKANKPVIIWRSHVPVADVYIVCVPTPDKDGVPDYSYIMSACSAIASVCPDTAIVSIESTVAPGTVTGRVRNLFKEKPEVSLVYSPERINPGPDAYAEFTKCTKLIGVDNDAFDLRVGETMKSIYGRVFDATTVVEDTRAAELAKCFENFQRDLNIAAMNELSMHCYTNGIDIRKVVEALATKDTGLNFTSGFVGGHCIPVDPYYLAEWYGGDCLPAYGRLANEFFIKAVYRIAETTKVFAASRNILILGMTYKPDVADIRNSGGGKLHDMLLEAGYDVAAYDPVIDFNTMMENQRYNVIIGAVNHSQFHNRRIADIVPAAIDCTFINVGNFTTQQTSGIYNTIHM